MKLLVVDDSEDFRSIMQVVLSSAGYENLIFATSGRDALSQLGIDPVSHDGLVPGIILLDVMMPPGIDGIETCARIRSDQRYHDVPILMVTAEADTAALEHAFVAGANDYITKPINRSALIARVRSAIKLKTELDRHRQREHELLELLKNSRGGLGGRAQHASAIDPATGLLRGDILDLTIHGLADLGQASRHGVLVILFDSMIAYEEEFGEAGTQRMIGIVARQVASVAGRLGTILASYGKALAILAPDTTPAECEDLARHIQKAVMKLGLPNPESTAAEIVTVSIGIALPDTAQALQQGVTQAFQAAEHLSAGNGNAYTIVRTGA